MTETWYEDVDKLKRNSLNKLRMKLAVVLTTSIFGIIGATFGGYRVLEDTNTFFQKKYFEFHPFVEIDEGESENIFTFKMNKPVTIENLSGREILVPVLTTKEIRDDRVLTLEEKSNLVSSTKFGEVLDGIWTLESTRGANTSGHHKYCDAIGMSNEFGYGALDKFCFHSFQESVEYLSERIESDLMDKSLTETLCYYNTGRVGDCDYAIAYKSL